MQIELTGWTHVHTYFESHGEFVEQIYQKTVRGTWDNAILLYIVTYRDPSCATDVHVEIEEFTHDYLLARLIRNDPVRYVPITTRAIAPCCTAGYNDFRDIETDRVYRVTGVAGHGEWAFPLD